MPLYIAMSLHSNLKTSTSNMVSPTLLENWLLLLYVWITKWSLKSSSRKSITLLPCLIFIPSNQAFTLFQWKCSILPMVTKNLHHTKSSGQFSVLIALGKAAATSHSLQQGSTFFTWLTHPCVIYLPVFHLLPHWPFLLNFLHFFF